MNLYFELLRKPIFNVDDVNQYYDNMDSSRSAIKRLLRDGLAVKIRNNMYTCISGESEQPVANRFQIASNITPTSYISHHTAMEYYGIANQVYYDVYVSSNTSFRNFEFDGYTYHYVSSKTSEGIEKKPYSGSIVVTDLERTLVDSVKDMDKIAGMEEVMQCISSIYRLREKRILKYLALYQNQFLYQKIGFLLWTDKDKLGLSDNFFEICKSQIGKSKRYLTKDIEKGCYNNDWKLIVPINIFEEKWSD